MSNIRDFIDLNPLYDLVTNWKMANEHVRSAEEELDGAESNMLEADPVTVHEAEYDYHDAQAELERAEDELERAEAELHQAIEAVSIVWHRAGGKPSIIMISFHACPWPQSAYRSYAA